MKLSQYDKMIQEWRKKYGLPSPGDFALMYEDAADLIELCQHGEMLHIAHGYQNTSYPQHD